MIDKLMYAGFAFERVSIDTRSEAWYNSYSHGSIQKCMTCSR